MPLLSGTSRETKALNNHYNHEISATRYDDSIISMGNETQDQIIVYPEEECAELIENKFRFTYAGISKEDIIQRSTKDLFQKIRINL